MNVDIHMHYLAVLVAAVASYAIAAVWYGAIFAKTWVRLTGVTDMKPAPMNIVLVLVGTFVMAFVLYHSIVFGDAYFAANGAPMSRVTGGLMGGFFGWLGYVAPVTLCTKLYEKKPWGLWLLDNGFWLVALLVMGTILSLWM
ncbi:MAG TPA: DUF1761 domain-containing protein [Gemmatimonadales bacterium]|nr:DUF1761 domain-containing protein [Gemmatimonadales bacterium]